MFAHPSTREGLRWCFDTVLGCGPEISLALPGLSEPVLAYRFRGGGSVSIEFTTDGLDKAAARRGAWLEIQADDPEALKQKILDAGLPEVTHPGHDFYFAAPGGQVFTVVPASEP
ncbi:MAG TPA: hypothetical protein VGR06_33475 [Actinophytocola sp.]|jgi:hypothetical protein|uniref:hypothetical protein n=1 Tax=Actinophytocola sp. TaxID=1872138 RepID=UPI002DFD09AE|nr:hypothetical protein [Actinophytocola sp.]